MITIEKKEIRFIDLFGGIGGFRFGLERCNNTERSLVGEKSEQEECGQGGKWTTNEQRLQFRTRQKPTFRCVWYCDNDKYAVQTYNKNFKEDWTPTDIRNVEVESIPDFEILCSGFPCQAFSIAGQRRGFQDTRGTLFFEICRILEGKQSRLCLLENVKGLINHDKGLTFQIILESLDELGYDVEWQVLNSKHFGVPQNRERVFIIGHSRKGSPRKVFPIGQLLGVDKKVEGQAEIIRIQSSGREMARVYSPKGISPTLRCPTGGWHEPKIIADRTRTYANLGRNLESPKEISNALSRVQKDNLLMIPKISYAINGHYYKGGRESMLKSYVEKKKRQLIPVPIRFRNRNQRNFDPKVMTSVDPTNTTGLTDNVRIRRLTPVECERLQGFPDNWTKGVSNTQRYRQMGNAVTVNVIEAIGRKILEVW